VKKINSEIIPNVVHNKETSVSESTLIQCSSRCTENKTPYAALSFKLDERDQLKHNLSENIPLEKVSTRPANANKNQPSPRQRTSQSQDIATMPEISAMVDLVSLERSANEWNLPSFPFRNLSKNWDRARRSVC